MSHDGRASDEAGRQAGRPGQASERDASDETNLAGRAGHDRDCCSEPRMCGLGVMMAADADAV